MKYPLLDVKWTDEDRFLDWLAGFVDGEGCFGVWPHNDNRQYRTGLSVKLRDDDTPILIEIMERLKMGRIGFIPAESETWKARVRWDVASNRDALCLVHIFDAHPLRAKKARDYAVWREAVLENQKSPKQRDLNKLCYLANKIKLIRAYEPQPEEEYGADAVPLSFPTEGDDDA
jgi:hypothetical protein